MCHQKRPVFRTKMVKKFFVNYQFSDKGRTIVLSVTCPPLVLLRRKMIMNDIVADFEITVKPHKQEHSKLRTCRLILGKRHPKIRTKIRLICFNVLMRKYTSSRLFVIFISIQCPCDKNHTLKMSQVLHS